MSKEILFGNEAHKKIETGVRTLAGAVKITLGPKGRNAVLERKFASPLVTNDGILHHKHRSSVCYEPVNVEVQDIPKIIRNVCQLLTAIRNRPTCHSIHHLSQSFALALGFALLKASC